MANKELSILERLTAPTSKFFKIIRTVGISLAAVGGALIASPVVLPAAIVTAAGYLTVAGGVLTALAQATVEGE